MRILGVDPGTLHLGWGLVDSAGNRMRHVAHGVIDLNAKEHLATRLDQMERELSAVIREFRPEGGSVETLFFHKDPQAASKLGHARGVVLFTLARAGLPVFEYAPTKVKQTVTGRGRADKTQGAMRIRTLFALERPPKSDAADALALAVTHLRRAPLDAMLQANPALRPKKTSRRSPPARKKSL